MTSIYFVLGLVLGGMEVISSNETIYTTSYMISKQNTLIT